MRTITIFSTVGNKKKVVQTEATTWKGLKKDLDKEEVTYNGMRAIVGENQVTLESDQAKLPIGLTVGDEVANDFTLFLSPKKSKAGASTLSLLKQAREILEVLEARLASNEKRAKNARSNALRKEIETLSKKAQEIEASISE